MMRRLLLAGALALTMLLSACSSSTAHVALTPTSTLTATPDGLRIYGEPPFVSIHPGIFSYPSSPPLGPQRMIVIKDQQEIHHLFREVNDLPPYKDNNPPQAACGAIFSEIGELLFFHGKVPTLYVGVYYESTCDDAIKLAGLVQGEKPHTYIFDWRTLDLRASNLALNKEVRALILLTPSQPFAP